MMKRKQTTTTTITQTKMKAPSINYDDGQSIWVARGFSVSGLLGNGQGMIEKLIKTLN